MSSTSRKLTSTSSIQGSLYKISKALLSKLLIKADSASYLISSSES